MLVSYLMVACTDSNDAKNGLKLNINETNRSAEVFSELARLHAANTSQEVGSLNEAVTLFLSEPTEQNRSALGEAWKSSHSALLRLGAETLSDENATDSSGALLYRLDAWPIQPGYIDSIENYPNSGIVNDITVTLSVDSLRQQHGFSDVEEIILGFHPLEYLIFAKNAIHYQLPEHGEQSAVVATSDTPDPVTEQEVASAPVALPDKPSEDSVRRRRKLLELLGDEVNESLSLYLSAHLEGVPYATAAIESQQQAAQLAFSLLAVAHNHASQGFEESNLLLDSDQSHSMFSQTSHLNVTQRINSLTEVLNEPVWLSRSLARLDENIEKDLQTTLAQGTLIIENGEFSESDRARLVTIFSALSHQLEDLQLKLVNSNP